MLHFNMFVINLIILLSIMLLSNFVEHSFEKCISADGVMRDVNSVWKNDKGCKCSCIAMEITNFEQCEDCNKYPKNAITLTTIKKMCHSNGFQYAENETWMSSETACTQCKCQLNGENTCLSNKHCSNTCLQNQVPKYGECCEVLQCSGKSPTYQDSVKCWDTHNNISVEHGKMSIRRERCIDKFCICYNGRWKCHNYCQLSKNAYKYWNKFCCPRPIGQQPCSYDNQILQPGEKAYFKEVIDNCTCLSGTLYCDRINNMNITSLPASSKSLPILITLIFLIGFILCCFILIVLCNNLNKYKQKILRKEKPVNVKLLNDYQDDIPKNQESPIDEI